MSFVIVASSLLAGGLSLGVSKRIYGTPVSPLSVFVSVWVSAILLLSLEWVVYIEVRQETWLILVGVLISFVAGVALASSREMGPRRAVQQVSGAGEDPRYLRRMILALWVLGMIGFLGYLRTVQNSLGADLLLSEPYLVRRLQTEDGFKEGVRIFRSLYYFAVPTIAYAAYYVARYGVTHSWIPAVGVLAFGSTLGSTDRTMPFMGLIWGFFVVLGLRRSGGRLLGWKAMGYGGLFAGLLLVFFVLFGSWIGKTLENNPALQEYSQLPESASYLATPYVYLTSNIPAFQEYIQSQPAFESWGKFTLLPLVKVLTTLFGLQIELPKEVGDNVLVPFECNTYTFLNVYWSDFGYLGVLGMPFLLGLFCTYLFRQALVRQESRDVLLSALVLYCLVNAVFVNKFISTPIWQHSIAVIVIARLTRRRPSVPVARTEGIRA